jgi:hypothetical protein
LISRSLQYFLDICVSLDLQKNVLYVSIIKVAFVSIISRSLILLRFSKISNNRLSKVVFHELSRFKTQNTEWPYFSYIRTLFEDASLDHFIGGNFQINTFNRFFGMNNKIKEREIIETKATFIIETYKTFFCKSRDTQYEYMKNKAIQYFVF